LQLIQGNNRGKNLDVFLAGLKEAEVKFEKARAEVLNLIDLLN